MHNVYHVSSPSASLFSSTQQAGWYSTGIFYKDWYDGFSGDKRRSDWPWNVGSNIILTRRTSIQTSIKVQTSFRQKCPKRSEDIHLGYPREFPARVGDMIFYQFYRRIQAGEDCFIGVLPERRKQAQRITHQSIMNWARLLVPEYVLGDKHVIYFVQVEIK